MSGVKHEIEFDTKKCHVVMMGNSKRRSTYIYKMGIGIMEGKKKMLISYQRKM